MTAQDMYRTMMRNNLAPRLRGLGWKGHGQSYELPDPEMWVQLRFQLSRYNTAASLRFTVNVSAIGKAAWATARSEQPEWPSRPMASRNYGPAFFHKRIGDLMPADEDIWWEVSATPDPDRIVEVADGVYAAVAEYAMPALRTLIATQKP